MMLCGKLESFPPEKQVICLPVLELTLVHIYIANNNKPKGGVTYFTDAVRCMYVLYVYVLFLTATASTVVN